MTDVPVRELRNDTAAVLRRVESGESITITVHGAPVARLVRCESSDGRVIPRNEFVGALRGARADGSLRDDLRGLVGQTTHLSFGR